MKRFLILTTLIAVLLASVGMVGAQEPEADPEREGRRGAKGQVMETILEVTGLEAETLREALHEEGATLSNVLSANGADVDAVKAAVVEAIVAETGADVAEVTERVNEMFETPRPERGERGPREGGPREGGPNGPPFNGENDA